jgi:hypothetical protein
VDHSLTPEQKSFNSLTPKQKRFKTMTEIPIVGPYLPIAHPWAFSLFSLLTEGHASPSFEAWVAKP